MQKFNTITFRVDEGLRARIEEQAKREDRSMSYIINRALTQLESYDFDLEAVPQKGSKAQRSG